MSRTITPKHIERLPVRWQGFARIALTERHASPQSLQEIALLDTILLLLGDLSLICDAARFAQDSIHRADHNLFRLGVLSANDLQHSEMFLREALEAIERTDPAEEQPAPDPARACRICGCTEEKACIDPTTGIACHWIEADLCSECATHRGSKAE